MQCVGAIRRSHVQAAAAPHSSNTTAPTKKSGGNTARKRPTLLKMQRKRKADKEAKAANDAKLATECPSTSLVHNPIQWCAFWIESPFPLIWIKWREWAAKYGKRGGRRGWRDEWREGKKLDIKLYMGENHSF